MAADIIWDSPVPPDELTFFMRELPTPADNKLSNAVTIDSKAERFINWAEITKRNRFAKYRAWDGRMATVGRDNAEGRQVPLAPFSLQMNSSEYEALELMYAQMEGGNRARLADQMYNDAQDLTAYMHNRVELGLGQVLQTRKFSVNENGVRYTADFGANAYPANTITFPVALTDAANAKAADYLRNMVDTYRASNNGADPGQWIMTQQIVDLLLKNAQLVSEVLGTTNTRTRINRNELTQWFTDNMLPTTIVLYSTSFYDDDNDVDVPVLNPNLITLTAPSLRDVIGFRFGLCVTAEELVHSKRAEFSWADAPGIVGMQVKQGPPLRKFMYTDAVGIPVLWTPSKVVTAVAK